MGIRRTLIIDFAMFDRSFFSRQVRFTIMHFTKAFSRFSAARQSGDAFRQDFDLRAGSFLGLLISMTDIIENSNKDGDNIGIG